MKKLYLFLLLPAVCWLSCTNNDLENNREVNPEAIYFDYQVTGEDGDEDITVLIQFRFGGSNGSTLVLERPSLVALDGEPLQVDSTMMTGAFYEIRKPVKDFAGTHGIVFTDVNQKKYEEKFSFRPIVLRTPIPSVVERGDLVLDLDGLEPVDYVRIIMTDTAFASEGINRLDTVKNGRVLIRERDLKNVFDGPVHLELYMERERPVKDRTSEGGRLAISYGINREFVLAPAGAVETPKDGQ